jgi:hypothetical protein
MDDPEIDSGAGSKDEKPTCAHRGTIAQIAPGPSWDLANYRP